MKLRELIDRFEEACPINLRYQSDPVGLQVGDLDQDIQKVMVSLDVRPQVVEEARSLGVDLIFSHHPLIFRPLTHLHENRPQEKMIRDLIRSNISVYSAHTNLDIVPGGMNDWFVNRLHLSDVRVLKPTQALPLLDLRLECSSSQEDLLSSLDWPVKASLRERAIEWEAYQADDIFVYTSQIPALYQREVDQLIDHLGENGSLLAVDCRLSEDKEEIGLGRVGLLEQPMSPSAFTKWVKELFNWSQVRLVGKVDQIHRVAILAGAGGEFYPAALAAKADAYISGDLSYHISHDIEASGLMAIDPGHFMEAIIRSDLPLWLQDNWPEVKVISSTVSTNPFRLG